MIDSGVHAARAKIWAPALDESVELFQAEPTRLGKASNREGEHYFIASRLDRMYSSFLTLQLTTLNARTSRIGTLTTMNSTIGSDHIGVGASVSHKKGVPTASQPMPRWVAEHPMLADNFENLSNYVDYEAMDPFTALAATKIVLRKAEKLTEKQAFSKDPDDPAVRMHLILQLARAVATQDARLALKVTADMPELRDIIEVGFDKVWVLDQRAMDHLSQGIARKSIDNEIEKASNKEGMSNPRGGRNAALQRQQLLWAPLARKALNVAIIRSDGSTTSNDDEKAE